MKKNQMNNENEKENVLLYEVIDPIYMGIRIRNLIRMYNKMYHREVISEHDTPKIERQLKHEILCNCHESKIRMTQQYQDIINHIKSDSVTQTDLGQAAAMNGWLSNSTDQTFKNQLKIKNLIQTLKEILDRRDINDRQWNYSIQ